MHGQLKSETMCQRCDYTSRRFDSFSSLQVDLPLSATAITVLVTVVLVPDAHRNKWRLVEESEQLCTECARAL